MSRRKSRMGRPPIPEGDRVAARKHIVRLSVEADALFREAARQRGVSLSDAWRAAVVSWLRDV